MKRSPERLTSRQLFPWRAFFRAFLTQAGLLVVLLFATGLSSRYLVRRHFLNQARTHLRDVLGLLEKNLPPKLGADWCSRHATGTQLRFTVIDRSGAVRCDSHHDVATMENHRERPEVVEALARGFGETVRYSQTLREDLMYGALATDGIILRAALPLHSLSAAMRVVDLSLWSILLIIGFGWGLWAIWSTRILLVPLGRLLEKTHDLVTISGGRRNGLDEWSVLENNIETLRKNLAAQTQTLSDEKVQLDTVIGAISDAILAVDREGAPLFFNSRFAVIFGAESLRRPGIKLWEMFREPEVLEGFRASLAEGAVINAKTIAWEERVGRKRYFSLSISPLRSGGTDVYGAVGIFHDITDLKSAEQMRIDFVANATHELRTPLTAIKGFGETLAMDVQDDKPISLEFVQAINRNADRLMHLMNDLLDLSSLESGDILHKEWIAVEDFTTRTLRNLQGGFVAREQSLETIFLAKRVYADPSRLDQVVVNLLDNANKYAPLGGKVRIEWLDEEEDTVLRVWNSGPGIPVEHQGRLFERFYRVDKARSREQGGTGLGLAIVKHIVQRHEGIVGVTSRPGEGTMFTCRFPKEGTGGRV